MVSEIQLKVRAAVQSRFFRIGVRNLLEKENRRGKKLSHLELANQTQPRKAD